MTRLFPGQSGRLIEHGRSNIDLARRVVLAGTVFVALIAGSVGRGELLWELDDEAPADVGRRLLAELCSMTLGA